MGIRRHGDIGVRSLNVAVVVVPSHRELSSEHFGEERVAIERTPQGVRFEARSVLSEAVMDATAGKRQRIEVIQIEVGRKSEGDPRWGG